MRSGVYLGLAIVLIGAASFHPLRMSCLAADEAPAAQGDASEAKSDEGQHGSGVMWFIRCSGFIGLFILILSVYFVALVIRLFMQMKPEVEVPQDLIAYCRDAIAQRNFQGAYDAATASNSFLGRVLTKGIEQLQNGLPEARHAMERTGEAETVRLEKQISMMAVLGTLGPMIGLIGTLKGMIASFSVIAISGVTLKASQVAQGISEALLLTFEGVSLSIPAIYFYAFFRNRVSTIAAEAMLEAEDLLQYFFRSGRSKGTAPAGPAAVTRHPHA